VNCCLTLKLVFLIFVLSNKIVKISFTIEGLVKLFEPTFIAILLNYKLKLNIGYFMNYEETERLPNIFPIENDCNFITYNDIIKYFTINKLDLDRCRMYINFSFCLN